MTQEKTKEPTTTRQQDDFIVGLSEMHSIALLNAHFHLEHHYFPGAVLNYQDAAEEEIAKITDKNKLAKARRKIDSDLQRKANGHQAYLKILMDKMSKYKKRVSPLLSDVVVDVSSAYVSILRDLHGTSLSDAQIIIKMFKQGAFNEVLEDWKKESPKKESSKKESAEEKSAEEE